MVNLRKTKIGRLILNPRVHIIFLMALLSFVFLNAQIHQMDDGFLYEKFAETIVEQRRIDLSIPGFHGTDFFAALIYWLTGSHYSINILAILFAIFNIPLIFACFKKIFKNELAGVLAAYIYVLMPMEVFVALRGAPVPNIIFTFFLALYLILAKSRFSFLAASLAYLTRPFSIALAPFFIYKKQLKQFLLSLIIPVIYLLCQIRQVGQIMIGVHTDYTVEAIFSLKRFFLNSVYAFQNFFSIHNWSPFNQLGNLNMMRITPFISFFALFGLIYTKEYFKNRKLFYAIVGTAAISFVLPTALYRFDIGYFALFNWAVILLAIKPLIKWWPLTPVVAASFFFQFYYSYRATRGLYWSSPIFFIIPILVFIISLFYVWFRWKDTKNTSSVLQTSA